MADFTHFDDRGASRMVDVAAKAETLRTARARGVVRMRPTTLAMILDRRAAKGDVLEVARIAGVMGAKRTGDLIPLCHPIGLDAVEIAFERLDESTLEIVATAKVVGRTGVEMEAMTAVVVTALTVYDMCKAVDRGIEIDAVRLEEKSGGRSGRYVRSQAEAEAGASAPA